MNGLAAWIAGHAAATPDKPALIEPARRLSYGALQVRIERCAALLVSEYGLARGARVAWLGHNSADLLVLLFACARQGLILLPLNWRLSARERAAVLEDAGVALVIVHASMSEAEGELGAWRCVTQGYGAAGCARFDDEVATDRIPVASGEADDAVLLVYTSGTTGGPKGVVLTQAALTSNALNSLHMHDMVADDLVLTVLPLFHVGGLNIQTLPALYCGASVLLEPRFDAARTLALIAQVRPTLTVQVPSTMAALLAHPDWATTVLDSLRALSTGSTDVPRALIEAWHARGVPVIQVYGATETGPLAIYQRRDEAFTTVGSIGRVALYGEVRLVDAEGREVPCATPGEIRVRGPQVASGYWSRERQAAVPFADGWFASGDVAEVDTQGLYWFKDRIKHVIISGGENIYPAELERVLQGHPALLEAAVAGRPDARWGEVPVVVAVRRAPVERAEVLACFHGSVARYKQPQDVVFVEALPRTALGKVEVQKLRELAKGT